MPADRNLLQVYQAGPTTVIGFGGKDVLDDMNVVACRDQIQKLIADNGCTVLGVDLTGVRLVPSGLLGLLASIRRRGVDVHLYNPSADVREVLAVTNLDQLMPVHDVALETR
jgi:anti-sigma B factor antagonist